MKDFALLLLRLTSGGLLAGHGAQKLFGAFGGPGLKGTSKWMEGMGLEPSEPWAALAGASEFGGGILTAAGLLNPIGTLGIMGAMGMATTKVHWGKPIWVTSGGAEYPITNMAIALALGLLRPGKYSLDNVLHIQLPRRLVLVPGLLLAAAGVAVGLLSSAQRAPKPQIAQQAEGQQAEAQLQPEEEQHEAVRVPERPDATNPEPVDVQTEAELEQEMLRADLEG
jgi:putative oxidoreductase